MKERPFTMSAYEVLATLDGNKTQARRLLKPQPPYFHYIQRMWGTSPDGTEHGDKYLWREVGPDYPDAEDDNRRCPYGVPGDRLWVRETFALSIHDPETHEADTCCQEDWDPPVYEAGYRQTQWRKEWVVDGKLHSEPMDNPPWRLPVWMPRWASRLTLRITDVRVEQLKEITELDASKEGVSLANCIVSERACGAPTYCFRHLWDLMNAKRGMSWDANPWVWVIEFAVDDAR